MPRERVVSRVPDIRDVLHSSIDQVRATLVPRLLDNRSALLFPCLDLYIEWREHREAFREDKGVWSVSVVAGKATRLRTVHPEL